MTAVDDRPEETSSRRPPSNLIAEQSILGSVFEWPGTLDEAIGTGITSDDFYEPVHGAIWDAINYLANRGEPYRWLAVSLEMQRVGTDRMLPHAAYLSKLTDYGRDGVSGHYARKVCDLAAKRRALAGAARVEAAAMSPATDGAQVQAIFEAAAASVAAPVDETTWSTVGDVMQAVRDRYQETKDRGYLDGIRWGYFDVDKVMTPMQPGDLAVVVAWAGGGKSVVAANLALDSAMNQGKRGLVHALEMTRLDLGQRYAAKTGSLKLDEILNGRLTLDQEDHLDWAIKQVTGAPLIIDEVTDVNLSRLRASIRKHKPDLVIVDQIPIMRVDDPKASREQQLTKLAYDLKNLAASEHVVIVACAQLNSAPMQRAEKLPTLQDIRESRGIGQAATIAVFLHDPTAGVKESTRAGEIDWVIRKQRQGKSDEIIPMAQQFHYSRLADLYDADR